MARADQRIRRQGQDLVPYSLAGHLPGLIASPNRSGKNCVTDDRHVRRILRPGSDDVGGAVFSMPWRGSVGDSQTAKMDEIIGSVPLINGGVLCAGMEPNLWEYFADDREGSDVVGMRVGDEKMAQLQVVLFDQVDGLFGIPAGVEKCGFT